ncbi:DUF3180 domain-containing protein [Kineococcus gynurae]|uniref:DUF3180 domain-containing protein n=1 Tax=Kineococcus gynurae TaxID=452979 RepID=A0ABV5LTT2_9ACTN
MRPTRPVVLVVLFLAVGVLTWTGLRIWVDTGRSEPDLVWRTVVTLSLLAIAVLGIGWPVRQWVRGEKQRRIDALRAARTAALAKAGSHAGAALAGFFTGYVVQFLPTFAIAARRDQLWIALVDLLVSVLLLIAGLVVERWCRVPEDEDTPPTTLA